jgi:hypothetical protein
MKATRPVFYFVMPPLGYHPLGAPPPNVFRVPVDVSLEGRCYQFIGTRESPLVLDRVPDLGDRPVTVSSGDNATSVVLVVLLEPERWSLLPPARGESSLIILRAELNPETAAAELEKKRRGKWYPHRDGVAGEREVRLWINGRSRPDQPNLLFREGCPLHLVGAREHLKPVLEHRDLVVGELADWGELEAPVIVVGASTRLKPAQPASGVGGGQQRAGAA